MDQVRAAAREAWREQRARALDGGQAPSAEESRRQGREEWLTLRAEQWAKEPGSAVPQATEPPIPAAEMRFSSPEAPQQSVENGLDYRRQQREPGREREANEHPPVVGARRSGAALSLGQEDREHERLERPTAQELRQEIAHRRPEPVNLLIERDAAVQAAER